MSVNEQRYDDSLWKDILSIFFVPMLRQSDNPFDLAHYAGMQAWKHRRQDARKLIYMKTMLNILDERGWSHEKKAWLLWFIEGIMHINDDHLWEEWEQELDHRKEETAMYVSLMERKGIKKGVERGMQRGMEKGMQRGMEKEKFEMARRMLEAGEPDEKILLYAQISPEQLAELRKDVDRESPPKE